MKNKKKPRHYRNLKKFCGHFKGDSFPIDNQLTIINRCSKDSEFLEYLASWFSGWYLQKELANRLVKIASGFRKGKKNLS